MLMHSIKALIFTVFTEISCGRNTNEPTGKFSSNETLVLLHIVRQTDS